MFENVSVGYGSGPVVRDVSGTVLPGEVVAVLGINGAGKTTLMHALIGFLPLAAGRVALDGVSLVSLRPHAISHRGLALVPQGRRIFRSLSVNENLALAARGRAKGRWNRDAVLTLFPRLAERLDHRGNELSGGEQQMLAWGRALLTNPRCLLMDEPTEGLSPRFVRALAELVPELKRAGLGILLAEQNIEFAWEVADRILILVNGEVTRELSADELRGRSDGGVDAVTMLASIVQGLEEIE